MMNFFIVLFACNGEQSAQDIDQNALQSSSGFESASECQDCHPNQYQEWSQSMHAYAGKSPVFDAMALKAYRDTSGEIGTFCTGCHSPVGELEGESGALTATDRSETSLQGVSCDYCHTAVQHDGIIGNNRLEHEPGEVKFGPFASTNEQYHLNEESDFIQSPELCGSCHDVFAYPGILIEQAYTEYTTSPSAEQGQTCQDCHMSPTPGVETAREFGPAAVVEGETFPDRELSSHRFIGPDYSLIDDFPYPNDLEASAQAQEEMLEQIEILLKNSIHISSLTANRSSTGIHIELELESLTGGHRVPTGFTSERQLWVHLEVMDNNGNIVFQTGALDPNGDIYDSHSQYVIEGDAAEDLQLINLQSRNLAIGRQYSQNGGLLSFFDERVEYETIFPFDADYIDRRSLAPLEKRTYDIDVVTNTPGSVQISAALRYRNLPPYLLRALHLSHLVERLNIFTISEQEQTVP